MQFAKLGLFLALGTLGVISILATRRPAVVRVKAGGGSDAFSQLPAGRCLPRYHLLTPGRN